MDINEHSGRRIDALHYPVNKDIRTSPNAIFGACDDSRPCRAGSNERQVSLGIKHGIDATGIPVGVFRQYGREGAVGLVIPLQDRTALALVQPGSETRHKIVIHIVGIDRHIDKIFGELACFGLNSRLRDIRPLAVAHEHDISGTMELRCPATAGQHIQRTIVCAGKAVRDIRLRAGRLIRHLLTGHELADYAAVVPGSPLVVVYIDIAYALIGVALHAGRDRFEFPHAIIDQIVFERRGVHVFRRKGINRVPLYDHIFDKHFAGLVADIVGIDELMLAHIETEYSELHRHIRASVVERNGIRAFEGGHVLVVEVAEVSDTSALNKVHTPRCIGDQQNIRHFVIADLAYFAAVHSACFGPFFDMLRVLIDREQQALRQAVHTLLTHRDLRHVRIAEMGLPACCKRV